MTRIVVSLVLALWCLTGAATPGPRWVRAFPDVPYAALVWYDPPDTYWVTTCVPVEGKALLRTEDGGASWETVADGLRHGRTGCDAVVQYGVVRSNPNVIYKDDEVFYRSEDGGEHWDRVEFPPVVGEGVTRRALAVSPRHERRIAHRRSGRGGRLRVIDLDTNEIGGTEDGTTWTHPESGEVYYQAGQPAHGISVGRVDFDSLSFVPFSSTSDHVGGFGFASDDSRAFLSVELYVFDRAAPIEVWRAGDGENPSFSFDTAPQHLGTPTAVAYHAETDMMVLAGKHLERQRVIASGDGGATWVEIGDRSGMLYFLTGHDAVYMQTSDGLYMLRLPMGTVAATSPTAKLTKAWGALKRNAVQ